MWKHWTFLLNGDNHSLWDYIHLVTWRFAQREPESRFIRFFQTTIRLTQLMKSHDQGQPICFKGQLIGYTQGHNGHVTLFTKITKKRGVIAMRVAKGHLLHAVAPNKLGYRSLQRFLAGESFTPRGGSTQQTVLNLDCRGRGSNPRPSRQKSTPAAF